MRGSQQADCSEWIGASSLPNPRVERSYSDSFDVDQIWSSSPLYFIASMTAANSNRTPLFASCSAPAFAGGWVGGWMYILVAFRETVDNRRFHSWEATFRPQDSLTEIGLLTEKLVALQLHVNFASKEVAASGPSGDGFWIACAGIIWSFWIGLLQLHVNFASKDAAASGPSGDGFWIACAGIIWSFWIWFRQAFRFQHVRCAGGSGWHIQSLCK